MQARQHRDNLVNGILGYAPKDADDEYLDDFKDDLEKICCCHGDWISRLASVQRLITTGFPEAESCFYDILKTIKHIQKLEREALRK